MSKTALRNKKWAFACGLACLGAVLLAPAGRRALVNLVPTQTVQAAPPSDDTFKRVWTITLPGVRAASLSPDGQSVGVVFNALGTPGKAKLGLWRWADRPVKPLWARASPLASQVAVGPGGRTLMTWAKLDPTQKEVFVRRGLDGVQTLAPALDGAVWDAQVSPDGQYAAVSTGGHSLYLLSLGDHPKLHRWTLRGLGNSLAFAPHSDSLTAATWDSSGVSCYSTNGAALWEYPAQPSAAPVAPSRLFEAQAAQGGSSTLGVSYSNVRRSDAGLYLWRGVSGGVPCWQYALGADAYQPKAAVTADGRYVAVGYLRIITRGEQSVPERRLAFLDTHDDKPLWEQGNLLFAPQLVALSPDGTRITVWDGQRSLYNLNAQGRVTSSYTLRDGGLIRQISATPDGRFVLVYTGSGQLSLFQIGQSST